MERNFNLIKTDQKKIEERILPRFPFSYLTFKSDCKEHLHAFQVDNISHSGMRIGLKNGGHKYTEGQEIKGSIHWRGLEVLINGRVMWTRPYDLGVEFSKNKGIQSSLQKFFSVENIVAGIRAVNTEEFDIQTSGELTHWLRADGPAEIFIWQHVDREYSKFQFILLDSFVEWQDGVGVTTGKASRQKDLDAPLTPEDVYLFEFDESVDHQKIKFALSVIEHLSHDVLNSRINDFLSVKLGKILA